MTDQKTNLDLHIDELNAMALDPRWKDKHPSIRYRIRTLETLKTRDGYAVLTPELVASLRQEFQEANTESVLRQEIRKDRRERGWQMQSHECYGVMLFGNHVTRLALVMAMLSDGNHEEQVQIDAVRRFGVQLYVAAISGYPDRLLLSFDRVIGDTLVMFEQTNEASEVGIAFDSIRHLFDFSIWEWVNASKSRGVIGNGAK